MLSTEANLLERFFSPRCIAIAGASDTKGKLGNSVMQRLLACPSVRLLPIHPRAESVLNVTTVRHVGEIAEPIDLLIALVPGDQLLPLIESCAVGQVGYLLAVTSGFAEVSVDGRQLQRKIVDVARTRGIRVVGPNSMGMLNAAINLNASLIPNAPPGGAGLSCVTQSGGFGIAASMYALDHYLPISKICDLGNTSDVPIPEVLEYLRADSTTRVVGLFLEALGSVDALEHALERLALLKPVILCTPGRTTAGKRASLAHLGIRADSSHRQSVNTSGSVIRAATGLDLLNVAKAVNWQPMPGGARAAILTATGGMGAELADLCIEAGLEVPLFSEVLQSQLHALLPSFAAVGNPIDITPIYWQFPQVYPALLRVLMASAEIDIVFVCITDVGTEMAELATAIVEELRVQEAQAKPCFVFWGSRDDALDNMRIIERAGVPCYRSTAEAVRAATVRIRQ